MLVRALKCLYHILQHWQERKLCAHPRLEIYLQDQIHFMCPLARQGDFYVPEVKETERKCRGLAEASDSQMDGTGTKGGRTRVEPYLESLFCASKDTVEETPLSRELALYVDSPWQRREGDTLHQDPHAELPVLRQAHPHKCGFTHSR